MTTIYRLLTGPDDASFCHKVSKALSQGWVLYGAPVYAFDAQASAMRCGQAVIKETEAPYDEKARLGDY